MSSDLHVILDKFSFLTKGIYQNKDSQHVCISHSIRLIPIISIGKINLAVFYTKNFSHAAHIHMHLLVEHIFTLYKLMNEIQEIFMYS